MNSLHLTNLLFAEKANWQHMGDGLHRGRGRIDLIELLPLGIVLAAVAIVIFLVVKVRNHNDMTQPCDDPNKLFRELSFVHDLDRASKKLLWRLADALHLDQPADVFLQPAYFQGDQIPEELHGEEEELELLLERLF